MGPGCLGPGRGALSGTVGVNVGVDVGVGEVWNSHAETADAFWSSLRRKKVAPCLREFRMTLTGVPINHACAHLNLTGYC